MKKKTLSILISGVLTMIIFTGCNNNSNNVSIKNNRFQVLYSQYGNNNDIIEILKDNKTEKQYLWRSCGSSGGLCELDTDK